MIITETQVKNFCEQQLAFALNHPDALDACFHECIGVIRFMFDFNTPLYFWWEEKISPRFWDAMRKVKKNG